MASFEERYGDPEPVPDGEPFGETYRFENRNYRDLTVTTLDGLAVRIRFASDDGWNQEEVAITWDVKDAARYARRFLPTDAVCGDAEEDGQALAANCESPSLGEAVGADAVAETVVDGGPGDAGYRIDMDDDGRATAVVVGVGPAIADASADDAYVADLKADHAAVVEDWNAFLARTRDVGSVDHLVDLQTFRDGFRALHEAWSDRRPPADLADLHGEWVRVLGLLAAGAHDLTASVETQDASLVGRGFETYFAAWEILQRIRPEVEAL